MPELRVDPVTGHAVVVAAGRAARPHQYAPASATASAEGCPFCPGNESATPPELDRVGPGAPGTPGWTLRAFANLYPIVGGPDATPGAGGDHEVVVLSPAHDRSFADLDDEAAAAALAFLARRVRHHHDAGRPFACAFVNQGRGAGASIAHPHAQVVALDHVPTAVTAALGRFAGTDPLEVDREHSPALPVPGPAAAWCPFASPSSGLVRVVHPSAGARFDAATPAELVAVAVALRAVLRALRDWLDDPAYNVTVHGAPPGVGDGYRWFVEVVPRVSVVGGFELLTGELVNTLPPEQAADALARVMR